MAKKNELLAVYAATTYRLFLPAGVCDLRVGQTSAFLRDYLRQTGGRCFSVLTADNPASQALSSVENAQRQAALEKDLQLQSVCFFRAENRPDTLDWPIETGFCGFDLSQADACRLAGKYGQNALIIGGEDAVPHLHWIKETE